MAQNYAKKLIKNLPINDRIPKYLFSNLSEKSKNEFMKEVLQLEKE